MKISKSLFLAFAGLGLFACSNEDVNEGGVINGPADVSVKIDLPELAGIGRSVSAPSSDVNVSVNYLKVALEAEKGSAVKEFTAEDLASGDWSFDNAIVFNAVESPTKITVEINTVNGEEPVKFETLEDLQSISIANTRMLGKTETFTAVPNSNTYTATVEMEHTMARLEFGGIVHATHAEGIECEFASGNLSGAYLNNVYMSPAVTSTDNRTVWSESEITNADFFTSTCPVADAIEGTNFLPAGTASYPAEGKVYAYNIYPVKQNKAESLPKFSLYFTNVTANPNTDNVWSSDKAYAIVGKYQIPESSDETVVKDLCGEGAVASNGYYNVINFPAGYVYKVTDLKVADRDIHPDPLGEGVDLVAVIKVTPWNIVNGHVEWQ